MINTNTQIVRPKRDASVILSSQKEILNAKAWYLEKMANQQKIRKTKYLRDYSSVYPNPNHVDG
jgi:hypothetical protein